VGGTSVASGCGRSAAVGKGEDVGTTVMLGAGENILLARGCPKTAPAIATSVKAPDVANHCQPVTMRARRVR